MILCNLHGYFVWSLLIGTFEADISLVLKHVSPQVYDWIHTYIDLLYIDYVMYYIYLRLYTL